MEVKYDFSGYATKNGLKCSDGRIINQDAFKHQDKKTVPLVWQHLRNEPANILGKVVLENRPEGVYCYGKFNDSDSGRNAKELVSHGDITSLSIFANELKEQAKKVMHGVIREVSLVLSGANPGALIDDVSFAHSDGSIYQDDSAALMYFDIPLEHMNDTDGQRVLSDTLNSLTDTQKARLQERNKYQMDDAQIDEVYNIMAALTNSQRVAMYKMVGENIAQHGGDTSEALTHAKHSADATVQEVFDTLDETQKTVVYAMIAHALSEGEDLEQSDNESDDDLQHMNEKGELIMKNNVFEQNATQTNAGNTLTHDQLAEIVTDAKRFGSIKESFLFHAAEYGFDPIDVLFPDARNVQPGGPQTYKRPDDWVAIVLGETTHTPFARIKTLIADLTVEEARARGYITGNRKKEEIIPLMKRITTPTTVYKKQKLDRDDITDITDFDVIIWLKNEMRLMLNEELARAVLIGDGRDISDESKINEQNIRPIALDDGDIFVHRASVTDETSMDGIIDEFIRARKFYRGSGSPTLFTSTELLTELLLIKDKNLRRIYGNVTELASVLRVSKIVEVELMNGKTRTDADGVKHEILGIVVNLRDYTIGADKGGEVGMFEDFDIDYNQNKYLIETRVSGALTRPKSALIMEKIVNEDEAEG